MTDVDITDALKALGHPARFRIVTTLRQGERNVGEIEQDSGLGQPALSQQLAVLRQAELVHTRRDGKLIYYALNQPLLRQLLEAFEQLAQDRDMPSDMRPDRRLAGVARFARLV